MTQVYEAIVENGMFRPVTAIKLQEGRHVRLVVEIESDNEEFAREMEEAARDPLFMQDIEECMADFAEADVETSRMIDTMRQDQIEIERLKIETHEIAEETRRVLAQLEQHNNPAKILDELDAYLATLLDKGTAASAGPLPDDAVADAYREREDNQL